MGKSKQRKRLPRKGAEAIRFIEQNAEVLAKRQEGSHVIMDVRGPKGEGRVNINVHGSKELSPGVWRKTWRVLVQIGVLSVIIFIIVFGLYALM
jgi:predicted RNA binding protein YcfA (HicA-like mRNA interferase family)